MRMIMSITSQEGHVCVKRARTILEALSRLVRAAQAFESARGVS
jgi:hypothetical protein